MPSNDYQRYVSQEQRTRKRNRIILEIVIAAVLIITAIIGSYFVKKIIVKKILSKVTLEPDSDGYKSWLNPPITTTRSYYLFNITNPNDIITNPKSTTIKLKDTPPYTYNVKTKKINVEWLNDNTEISYSVERSFIRDKTRFNESSLNDTGVFIDLLRAIFRTQFGAKPAPLFYTEGGYRAFYHRNAIEQLEGFTSSLFKLVRDRMVGPNTNMSGFVYRQNGSRLYNVSIKTDLMRKGQVNTFDSELVKFNIESPTYYPFPIYDSLTYPPLLPDKTSLNIFNSDFCSPILVEFSRSVVKFGINTHEYRVKFIDIKNCTNPSDTTTCNEVDRIDVSKCVSNSLPDDTIFLSKAHFYGSNNETMEKLNIDGFTPSSDKHDSVVYFEPLSGTPLQAVFRMQLNIEATIDPMNVFDDTSDPEPKNSRGLKRLVPVFWIDQEIDVDTEVKEKLKQGLFIHNLVPYAFISAAVVLSIIIIVIIECMAKCADKNNGYTRGSYMQSGR